MTYIRLICHDTPRQWHDCTDDFIKRLEAYCIKHSKDRNFDVWVQYQDGRRSITNPH